MAIKKYFVNSQKPGYGFDRKANKYFSWGYDIWIGPDRIQERGFLNKADCERAVESLKRKAKLGGHGLVPSHQIPLLIELFQKYLDERQDKDERVRAKRVFNYLLEQLPKNIKVTQLKTAHLQNFVETRLKDGVSAQTVRRELVPIVSALKSSFRYFASLDDYNPPRIPRPKVTKAKKERVIYKFEQEKLWGYFFAPKFDHEIRQEPDTRRRTGQFLLMCLLTLSRPGEIAALKKTDVDLEMGVISITGQKSRFKATQIVRRLRITKTMREILVERYDAAKTDYLFTRSGTVTPDMYECFKAACEKSGIVYSRTDPAGISFHTARHTGITMLVQSGVDLKTVAQLAGHSDQQMTMYYTHPDPQLVNRAALILEQKMGGISGNFLQQ